MILLDLQTNPRRKLNASNSSHRTDVLPISISPSYRTVDLSFSTVQAVNFVSAHSSAVLELRRGGGDKLVENWAATWKERQMRALMHQFAHSEAGYDGERNRGADS